MSLPANVSFGTVTGRFLTATADSPTDPDRDPEGVAATGLAVTFTPNLTPAVVRDASASPPTVFALAAVTATVGATGDLLGPDGQPGIRLVATTGSTLDPAGWSWKVTLSSPTFPALSFNFALDPGQSVDLASVVQVPTDPGASLSAWLQAVADAQAARDAAIAAATSAPSAFLSARIGSSDGSTTAYTGIGTFTIVPLDVVDYDSAGGFDTSTGIYTIPVTGYWQINAAVRPVDSQTVRQIGMGVDTANRDSATFAWLETNPNRTTLLYSRVSHFVAGEQVRLFTYADAEGTTNFNTGALSLTLLGT